MPAMFVAQMPTMVACPSTTPTTPLLPQNQTLRPPQPSQPTTPMPLMPLLPIVEASQLYFPPHVEYNNLYNKSFKRVLDILT